MRGISTVAVVAGLLSTCTDAIQLHKRTDGPPRVVGFPVQRKQVPNPAARDRLRRRQKTMVITLDNEQTLYFANGTLGTPAQSFRLHVDTGSSDLWVNTPKSKLCDTAQAPCSFTGVYSANDSTTYQYISSDFNISYVDGSGARGDYVSDTFTIGPASLQRLQFGVGYTSSSYEGILGIGYPINEVQVGRAGKTPYNNLPAQMVSEGFIKSNAFSLWLNDLDASTGSILFGGVDTAQYMGQLKSLPVQKTQGFFAEFLITLTKVKLGNTVIAANQAQAVLLDSGSSLTYLPDAITEAIYQAVGAQYDTKEGVAYVPCSLATNSSTLDFTFSDPTISVDMTELVIPVTDQNGRRLTFSNGTPACLFGIAPAGRGTSVMGDTFIRSAYLVFDMDNNEISIAQTNFNTTKSDVLEIGTGANAVPSATAVQNAVTAVAGVRGAGLGGETVALTSTSSSTAGAQRTAAPVGVGAVAAIGAGLWYAAM